MTDLLFGFLPGHFGHWLGIPISTNPRFVINVVATLLLLIFGLVCVAGRASVVASSPCCAGLGGNPPTKA